MEIDKGFHESGELKHISLYSDNGDILSEMNREKYSSISIKDWAFYRGFNSSDLRSKIRSESGKCKEALKMLRDYLFYLNGE